jgi:hypothetical protein
MVKRSRERKKFHYRRRDKEAVKKRANQTGGAFDSLFDSKFATFAPKDDDTTLRFLPPTWDDPDHYGYDIYVHYDVGSDSQRYLCPNKMRGENCPICEEKKRAEAEGDTAYAKTLTPVKRVLAWVINRQDEDSGPLLYAMPWTLDRDFNKLSIDKRSGEVLNIDDPEDGYDVEFSKTGKKKKVQYSGVSIARRSSPLSDDQEQADEWLEFVEENPVPDVLQIYDYEYIKSIAAGKKDHSDDDDEDAEEDEDDEDSGDRRKGRKISHRARDEEKDDDEEEDDRPTRARRKEKAGTGGKARRTTSRSDDGDDDDEEDEEPPRSHVKRMRQEQLDDADDDADDDDEDDEDEDGLPPRRRPRDEDEDDDDDEDEDRPRASKRRRTR